jgi:uncharacterized protein YggU (UPF0235/DUF167 family)
MIERDRRRSTEPGDSDVVVRVEVLVRPRSKATIVGGTHDGALVVRVAEPAHSGRANAAALHACASALGVPDRSVTLFHGATARRKVIEVHLSPQAATIVQQRLATLRST